ncbi:MAG TPA: hypothetical protein VFK61_08425 [Candidatus Limnocylindria bacterium]|jgi:hypothetical protein|nr:hypothetical protein [Candidatus Limnocylindria bacterium]
MNVRHSPATLGAAALLGTLAVAALVTGILFVFGAWVITDGSWAIAGNVGGAAAALLAALILGYGLLTAIAAWELWTDRPAGRLLGLMSGIIAILAAATALLVGDADEAVPLLWIAMALGAAVVFPLLLPDRRAGEGEALR